jgi:predicted nucleic acid-binding protein
LYTKHVLDFEDCLALAHMEQQNLTQIYSYDRGFDQVTGIQRLEPELLSKRSEEKETTTESDTA